MLPRPVARSAWRDLLRDPRRDAGAVLCVAAGLYTLGYLLWFWLHAPGTPHAPSAIHFAFLPVTLVAAALAWRASRHPALDEMARRAWRLVALAYLLVWAGDFFRWYLPSIARVSPFPSPADVLYLLFYPVLLWGLLSFPAAPRTASEQVRFWLDLLTLLLGGAMAVWYFAIRPIGAVAREGGLATALSLAYPLADLALLFGIATLLLREPAEASRRALQLLVAGLLAFVAGDLAVASLSVQGAYEPGGWPDPVGVVGRLLLALSAHYQYVRASAPRATVAAAPPAGHSFSLLPYAGVAGGYILLWYSVLQHWQSPQAPLLLGATALTGLVVARLILLLRQNVRLLAERSTTLTGELVQSEARFRSLVLNVSDIVTVVDPDGGLRYVSPAVTPLLGYRPEELFGRPSFDFIHPGDLGRIAQFFQEVAALPRAVRTLELRAQRRDGGWCWLEVSVSNRIDDPAVRGIVVTARDVTARKAAEEEIAQALAAEQVARGEAEAARRRLAFLARASELLTAHLDYQATLTQLTNLIVPELADWCILDVIERDGLPRRLAIAHADPAKSDLAEALRRRLPSGVDLPYGPSHVLRTGRPVLLPEISGEMLALGANGDPTLLELLRRVSPASVIAVALVARGATLGAMTLATAESRRRYGPADLELAEELARRAAVAIDNARLYHAAQNAVRARDVFLSVASHELKTPLTVLRGYAQVLVRASEREGEEEGSARALRAISEQVVRMSTLIDRLLDFSHLQSGRLVLEIAPVDLCALARRVVELRRPALERHTLELSVPQEPLLVDGDPLRLEQVLHNLIENAVKYSPAGGPVAVAVAARGDRVELAVADRGIGIPAESLAHLFEPYYRAANVESRRIGGTGLGLAVVREIVDLHHGTVEVSSREGEGSTFTVSLPLSRLAAAGEAPGAPS